MQVELALDVLEKSAFDGQFGEAVHTAENLMKEVLKIKYSPTIITRDDGKKIEVILMQDFDKMIKEVERPWE